MKNHHFNEFLADSMNSDLSPEWVIYKDFYVQLKPTNRISSQASLSWGSSASSDTSWTLWFGHNEDNTYEWINEIRALKRDWIMVEIFREEYV